MKLAILAVLVTLASALTTEDNDTALEEGLEETTETLPSTFEEQQPAQSVSNHGR